MSARSSDRAGERPAGVLEDDRVTHIWDADGDIARFLGERPELGVGGGFVYDVFLLFGPDGDFAAFGRDLETSGRTIIDASNRLADAFAATG